MKKVKEIKSSCNGSSGCKVVYILPYCIKKVA